MRTSRWTEADLLDLEVVLQVEEPLPEQRLDERDRAWYLEHGRSADAGRAADRRLLRRWLEARRVEHFAGSSPGKRFGGALRGTRWLLAGAGLVLGAGYAVGVLAYTGERAINLLAALALLALLPLVVSIASVVGLVLAAARVEAGGGASVWLVRRLVQRSLGALEGAGGDEDWARLERRSRRYRRVMTWVAFALAQAFALAFVAGAWLTVFARGWIADLAFAWQTSAGLTAATVHRLTTWLAAPWAWIDPPPNLEQVAGSRVALKEGLGGLANPDLTVWWSYLVWAVAVYAVLPRLALAASAGLGRRRALARVRFNDADSRRILRRLRTPHLAVDGEEHAAAAVAAGAAGLAGSGRTEPMTVLVPRDLARRRAGADWAALAGRIGAGATDVREVALDAHDDAPILAALPASMVLVIQEGWRPCIEEVRAYLRRLREAVGPDRPVIVGLLGRTAPGDEPRLARRDLDQWRRRLGELGDPALEVAALEAVDG